MSIQIQILSVLYHHVKLHDWLVIMSRYSPVPLNHFWFAFYTFIVCMGTLYNNSIIIFMFVDIDLYNTVYMNMWETFGTYIMYTSIYIYI